VHHSDIISAGEPAPAKPVQKLSQLAYARFKDALFDARIPIGATVTQADLTALLDVPLGPLREALQVLESEGLLTMLPRAGIRIVTPDMALVKDSFQLRRILECEAVRKFAADASDDDLARWDAAHRGVIAAAQDRVEIGALGTRSRKVDRGFHTALIGALRNPQIDEVYARVGERIRLVQIQSRYRLSPTVVTQTMEEHLAILAALRARDTEAAAAAMEHHIARTLHRAIGM
jgi:DNA-binding GntR family transcriptional regulator